MDRAGWEHLGRDPFLKSLAETRRLAARQGWCYQHVQALMVAIDHYAKPRPATAPIFWISHTALAKSEEQRCLLGVKDS